MFDIQDFYRKYNYGEDKYVYFDNFRVIDVLYRKQTDLAILKIENSHILPFNIYRDFLEYIVSLGIPNVKLYFKTADQDLSIKDINLYLQAFSSSYHQMFSEAVAFVKEDGILLSYMSEEALAKDAEGLDDLKLYFYDLGYRKEINLKLKEKQDVKIETYEPLAEKKAPEVKKEEYKKSSSSPNGNYYKPRSKEYTEVVIDDMVDTLYNIKFTAVIFKVDERTTKTGNIIQTLYVKDENNACLVKCMESRRFSKEILSENKEGRTAVFYGRYLFDTYQNDYLFEPEQIEFIEAKEQLKDEEEEKRIELHAHTNKSEMDAVCDATEIVKAAFKMGHEGVAITDHLDVQAFPEAQRALGGILKEHPDSKFKVAYGCEFNVVDSRLHVVYNPQDIILKEEEYCVLDFETTGLSTRHDYIIEFGAVILYKGIVKERKDILIKPPIELGSNIQALTHISKSDLEDAPSFAQAKEDIKNFIGNRTIVAHNAAFDFGFLNEELLRNGDEKLTNPVIDTLDLARTLFKNRRSYRLGNIARQYNVSYDENVAHRADYDAEVLSSVFHLMIKDLERIGITSIKQLYEYNADDAYVKNRAFHAIALVKNKDGLKDLFKLVSISNTETLAVFGKANTKSSDSEYVAEPRLLKETLAKYRKDLLLGSSCYNGEVFEMASTRNNEELAKAISFFDYIEVQPLDNYRFLVVERQLFTWDRLKEYIRDIIAEAKRQGKMVVATGDVHYVTEDEKILRDVYVNAQGIGGIHHPLFTYDKEKRQKQVTPKQHFRSTTEMLEAFSWLGDEQLIREIVIENPRKIMEMIETVKPIHSKLYTPVIDGSTEKLTEIVYKTAHEKYGEVLDPLIEQRIKRELDAIIGNGYGVIYYVSHLLVKKSNDDGYLVGSRGSVGSSVVATFSGITECNPLPPHYICPKCHHLEWVEHIKSGYDLPEKVCPECGTKMEGNGQNIPFETFLGFKGDKVPDIDLNFSGDYQDKAFLFAREVFDDEHVFRAGTISTVAEKTAFGYVSGYCEEKEISNMSRAQRQRLASGCEGVKRTTGQHPGGIIVIPNYMDVHDFTPIQYPANDPSATWRTTHFDFHEIHDNVLKFDMLGHVDPTAMKLLESISGISVKSIPMNDPKVMSIFNSPKALNIVNPDYDEETGACGLPEFGTRFVRGILADTRPSTFSELVQISGLSHGTDVWNNNAKDLIDNGLKLGDVIGCRDDIMSDLLSYDLPSKDAFDIMEKVRKGKGVSEEFEKEMLEHNVPKWYIDSCKKIKYMFPKAHAVAYVIMAVRVAWFKVYHPEFYYVSFFTLRCDAYEIQTMVKDADGIKKRLNELQALMQSKENLATKKDRDIFNTLEISYEMASRGMKMLNIDLNRSLATEFIVNPDNNNELIPPFKILDGLGDNVAVSIVEARKNGPFLSKEDLQNRTQLSTTLIKRMNELGILKGLDDSNQISLF